MKFLTLTTDLILCLICGIGTHHPVWCQFTKDSSEPLCQPCADWVRDSMSDPDERRWW